MKKKSKITEEESLIFRDVVRGVKPLKHNKVASTAKLIETPRSTNKIALSEPEFFPSLDVSVSVGSHELLRFSLPGIQHKILRNLRNGKYNVEATLDLHGKTIAEAGYLLSQFLNQCRQHGMRHVLVIHGKGRNNKPILKNQINHWLRHTEHVLAFSSATIKDGYSGAVYVLLKVYKEDE